MPFVAVYDVGQGNCNALLGADGTVQAYFDFGYSTTEARRPTPPTRPCVCNSPLIILSHWDRDHYNLGYHDPRALSLTWLVPEQKHSPIAGKFQTKIKRAGGSLVYWPKEPGLQRHMLFPWGWLERCTGDPNRSNETNSSGLAAFVCVQDSRWAASVRRGVAAPLPPNRQQTHQPSRRARRIVPLIGPLVGALALMPGLGQRVRKLAEPVAAMVAASQYTGTQNNLPLGQVATAVVRGVCRCLVNGDNAAQIRTALDAAADLGNMRAVNVVATRAIYLEIGQAIVAARGRRGRAARARHAAAAIPTWGAATTVDIRAQIARSALMVPVADVPDILQGHAPFPKGAKFVLLNGDANYSVVPSMRRNHRPTVVGMTAMHHGAIFEDGEPLSKSDIPFAPGSRPAKAIHRMRMGTSFVATVVAAGMARTPKRWKGMRRELRVAATRCGMAAAAAVLCVDRAYPGQSNYVKFALAAGAAAVASWRHRDSAVAGLAAALACVLEHTGQETGTSPLETVVDLAHKAVVEERAGPGITYADVQTVSKGMILRFLIPHVSPMAARAIARGHVGLLPDEAGVDADDAHKEISDNLLVGVPAKKRKGFKRALALHGPDRLVLNDIVTAAVTSILYSARGNPNRHSVRKTTEKAYASLHSGAGTNMDTLFANLRAVMQLGYGATPPGLAGIALLAGRLAAARAVAYVLGLTQEDISTVIRGAARPHTRRAAQAALGPIAGRSRARRSGGNIAYSYGVDPADGSHEYRSDTAGNLGHPHPLAILKYEAHGWFERFNTTSRAAHPGPQGDPQESHSRGHVALGWNSVARQPYPHSQFNVVCPDCGNSLRYSG